MQVFELRRRWQLRGMVQLLLVAGYVSFPGRWRYVDKVMTETQADEISCLRLAHNPLLRRRRTRRHRIQDAFQVYELLAYDSAGSYARTSTDGRCRHRRCR